MDLRHLRTFVTVAEQGTVSRAALHLRVAQPALSRQIADLEAELGVKLFDRVRRRLVLTGEGEHLLNDCRAVLGAVGSLSERALLLRRPDAGVLKVAATPQMIDGVLSKFLLRYAGRHPHVQVRLTEAAGPAALAILERGELHVAMSSLQALAAGEHPFETFLLPPTQFLACCNPSADLTDRASMDIVDLASHPLLLLDDSFFVRKTFDAACRLAGLRPNIFVESRTPHTLLSLAEAGHGVAIVPSVLPTQRYRLRVVRLTHRRRPLQEPLAILWDKRRALPGYAKDFCQALAAYMREVFPISRPALRSAAGKARTRKTTARATG
jgi:DNA-binding transcriptional LysR family regulator